MGNCLRKRKEPVLLALGVVATGAVAGVLSLLAVVFPAVRGSGAVPGWMWTLCVPALMVLYGAPVVLWLWLLESRRDRSCPESLSSGGGGSPEASSRGKVGARVSPVLIVLLLMGLVAVMSLGIIMVSKGVPGVAPEPVPATGGLVLGEDHTYRLGKMARPDYEPEPTTAELDRWVCFSRRIGWSRRRQGEDHQQRLVPLRWEQGL